MISFGGKKCVLWLRGVIHDQDVVVVDCDVCQCFVFLINENNQEQWKIDREKSAQNRGRSCQILNRGLYLEG